LVDASFEDGEGCTMSWLSKEELKQLCDLLGELEL
jgi:hypothetical protein